MHVRSITGVRVIIATAATILFAAGCGAGPGGHLTPLGGTSAGNGGQVNSGGQALSAAAVLRNVSGQTAHVTSVTGTILMQMSRLQGLGMQGSFKMRSTPKLVMEVDLAISGANQSVPGELREIITGNGIYLNMSPLAKVAGKPWIQIPLSKYDKAAGGSFTSMLADIKQQDPLSAARMLAASKDVTTVGTESVNGVLTTHLHGSFSYQQALAMLPAKLRKLEQPYAAAMGAGKITFDLWVDGQNLPRRIVETYSLASVGQTTMTLDFTSFNQPVTVTPPPAGEIATLPGLR